MFQDSKRNINNNSSPVPKSTTNRSHQSKQQFNSPTRSGPKATSKRHGNTTISSETPRQERTPKEIPNKKSVECQEPDSQKEPDPQDRVKIRKRTDSNSKEMEVDKPDLFGNEPNVDMNEVTTQTNFRSQESEGDGAPSIFPQVDEQLIAELDEDEENYVEETSKPKKRTRSIIDRTIPRSKPAKLFSKSKQQTSIDPGRKKHRVQRDSIEQRSSQVEIKSRLSKLEKLLRLQALANLQRHL
jgi:hypothetical protein